MRHAVGVRGHGRVAVTAYGIADAEHLVEKELGRLWPQARVSVEEVRKGGGTGRIVEDFEVAYRLRADVEVEADSREAAVAEAFRLGRARLHGSRYGRTELDLAE